jgi:tetratricopeptide (TPR) repeat protein
MKTTLGLVGPVIALALVACASSGNRQGGAPSIERLREARERYLRFTASDNDVAIELYREALMQAPTAEAHAGLAEALAQQFYNNRQNRAALDESLTLSTEAIRLNAHSAQAHFARAFALGLAGKPREAAPEYLRTLRLDADYPRAAKFALGQFWRAGMFDEAFRWAARQLEKEPTSLDVLFHYSVASAFLLDIDHAENLLRRALEIDPKFATAFGELAFLAQAKGRWRESVEHMEAAVRAEPSELNLGGLAQMLIPSGNPRRAKKILKELAEKNRTARAYGGRSVLTIYGWALWELGERAEANRVFDEMLERLRSRAASGETSYQLHREIAAIHAVRGNRSAAMQAAKKAVENGWHLYGSREMPDPMFRTLAGDPDFESLLARMREDINPMRRRVGLPKQP